MLKQMASAALCMVAVNAHAASVDGNYAIKGAGSGTCNQYSEARAARNQDYYIYAGWLDGFMTGLNQAIPATYDVNPWAATEMLAAMLDSFCLKHPDQGFHIAARRLTQALAKHRLVERSNVVAVGGGEQATLVYLETIKRAQRALTAAGHYQGKADGAYGEDTRAAMVKFQHSEGIAETGLPDQMTLFHLFRPKPADNSGS